MKNRSLISLLMALLMATALSSRAYAQEDYRFDIGGGVGMSGYLGDANSSNLWKNPGFDAELLFRYMFNPRIAIKTNFYAVTLRGDSKQMDNVFPNQATFKFSTTLFELGEMFEFNFFNYGIGETYRKLQRWTPYITAGIGFTAWTVGGKGGFSACIPLGVGFKYKLSERWNLGFEFLMKKSFSDKIDGEDLKDPQQIKSSFMKNTDWYSTMTFTISYEFSKRCAVCHYKE